MEVDDTLFDDLILLLGLDLRCIEMFDDLRCMFDSDFGEDNFLFLPSVEISDRGYILGTFRAVRNVSSKKRLAGRWSMKSGSGLWTGHAGETVDGIFASTPHFFDRVEMRHVQMARLRGLKATERSHGGGVRSVVEIRKGYVKRQSQLKIALVGRSTVVTGLSREQYGERLELRWLSWNKSQGKEG
jgi:hypothetical protein